MRKLISYVMIFVLGFVVCAYVLRTWYGPQSMVRPFTTTNAESKPTPPFITAEADVVRQSAAKVSQVVVNIDTQTRARVGGPGFPFDVFSFPFGAPQPPVRDGSASGVIISADGYILTNNHVVQGTQTRTVTLPSGKKYPSRIIGVDPRTDLAVIKINAKNLPYGKFNSNAVGIGDWVIAVGNALGLGPTVTVGVISATERDVSIENKVLEGMMQTDAAINPGNSGGALADLEGNIIGINTAIASLTPGGGNIGIGFATPARTAQKIANDLMKRGKVVRPWIGIQYTELTDDVRAFFAQQGPQPPKNGVAVMMVEAGSPAAKAGIRPYDIIVEINRKPVKDKDIVGNEVKNHKIGDKLLLLVWRGGDSVLIPVTLDEAPANFG